MATAQMKCIGGSARGLYDIDTMRCKNSGSDYDSENIQWTCTASLPEEFKLGSTDVICEGYDSPDDPYILKGSCGVEYRLILTDKGEEKYGKKKHWFGDDDGERGDHEKTTGDRVVSSLFWLVFIGVALWIVFNAVQGWAERRTFAGGPGAGNRPGWGGGGGGGGGWGGGWGGGNDDDPPPPYNPHPDPNPNPNPKRNYGGTEAWRPGFWSGALGGAAAGYAAQNWGNRNQNNQTGTGWGNSSGRWNNGEGSSRSSSGSSGTPSFSSTRHESTGFGSSSRR